MRSACMSMPSGSIKPRAGRISKTVEVHCTCTTSESPRMTPHIRRAELWVMWHSTRTSQIRLVLSFSKIRAQTWAPWRWDAFTSFASCLIVAHHWEGKRDKDIEDASNNLGYQYSNVFEESTYKSYSFSLFALRKSSFQKNCVILRTFKASVLIHECKHF